MGSEENSSGRSRDSFVSSDRLRDSFIFANTLQFLHLFSEVLGLDPLSPTGLERILDGPIIGPEWESSLGRIFKRLVKNLHRSKATIDEHTSQTLNREYRRHTSTTPDGLNPKIDEESGAKRWPLLGDLSPRQRLQALYDMCSFQLFDVETLLTRAGVRDLGAAWRVDAVGEDKQGRHYWFLADCWLYSEDGEKWKCIAWDTPSWQSFLAENALTSSRRASDKQLLKELREHCFAIAEPILLAEERETRAKAKREQLEVQRIALMETRKRSSRIAAQEKIRQEAEAEAEYDRSPKRTVIEESRPLTREERVALRHQRVAKIELEKALSASRDQTSEVDVEEEGDEEGSWREEEDKTPRSPIKLLVRMGPNGPVDTKLFIGDESVESSRTTKETPINQSSVDKPLGVKETNIMDINAVIEHPAPTTAGTESSIAAFLADLANTK